MHLVISVFVLYHHYHMCSTWGSLAYWICASAALQYAAQIGLEESEGVAHFWCSLISGGKCYLSVGTPVLYLMQNVVWRPHRKTSGQNYLWGCCERMGTYTKIFKCLHAKKYHFLPNKWLSRVAILCQLQFWGRLQLFKCRPLLAGTCGVASGQSQCLAPGKKGETLLQAFYVTGWFVEWCCHATGFDSQNPWDHYFHTAAGLTQKCRAVELVISRHLGSTSRNFWRMLETTWWGAW